MPKQSLIHEVAHATMKGVMKELADDIPYERRLTVMYLIYHAFKSGLEEFSERSERQDRRLYGPHTKTSIN